VYKGPLEIVVNPGHLEKWVCRAHPVYKGPLEIVVNPGHLGKWVLEGLQERVPAST